MRHGKSYRKLGRTSEHRRRMLRNMVQSLFVSESGRIRTTVEKAKEARRLAEKMITLGKRESVHARRLAARVVPDRDVIHRLFHDIAPRYAERAGGYTRILRVGPRPGDNAEMALLELVGIAEDASKKVAEQRAEARKEKESRAKASAAAQG